MLAVVWSPLFGMKSHILCVPSALNWVGIISCILLFQETVRKISFSCRNGLFGRQECEWRVIKGAIAPSKSSFGFVADWITDLFTKHFSLAVKFCIWHPDLTSSNLDCNASSPDQYYCGPNQLLRSRYWVLPWNIPRSLLQTCLPFMLAGSIKSLYLKQHSHIIKEITNQDRISESFYSLHYSLVGYAGTERLSLKNRA